MFGDVPNEVIELILMQLPAKDLLAFAATCRQYKSLVDSSPILRFALELAVEGFRLSSSWLSGSSSCSMAQMRRGYNSRQKSRKRFHYTRQLTTSVSSSRRTYAKSQLIDGMLGYVTQISRSDTDLVFWNLLDSTLYSRSMLPSLSDVQTMETELPYRTELAEPDLRHRLDLRLQSFTWDLPQDLLILFEVGDSDSDGYIHFRSLATNAPHPLAKRKVIQSQRLHSDAQIHHPYLIANYLSNWEPQMTVHDWTSGEVLYVVNQVNSFQLLNTEFVLITSRAHQELTSEFEWFSLRVLRLADGMLHCILKLPPLWALAVQIVQDGFRVPTAIEKHRGNRHHELEEDPYIYHPGSDRIAVVGVHMANIIGDFADQIHVIISIQHILATISSAPPALNMNAGTPSAPTTSTFDWAQWGPPATRWILGSLSLLAVYGSHFLIVRQEESASSPQKVTELFDFSQRYHRLHPYANQDSKLGGTLIQNWVEDRNDRSKAEGEVEKGSLSNLIATPIEEQIVTKEWVLDAFMLQYISDTSPSTTVDLHDSSANTTADEIAVGPDIFDPLRTKIRSQLPFRVYRKACPTTLAQFRREAVHLGLDGVVGEEMSNGVVHAFLF